MLNPEEYDKIVQVLPFLRTIDYELTREFQHRAYCVRIPTGREIFVEGDQVDGIALLTSGVVRVYKIGDTGRELTLYRFGQGESCVITANAILNMQNFPAIAVVEKEAEAVMVPAGTFSNWVRRHEPWRDFVFQLVSQRLASVMEIVEEVAFQRMDRRIASFLLERYQQENPIHITHQLIANELGTSREVVSRLLADFASRGLVALERGEITVLNPDALEVHMEM